MKLFKIDKFGMYLFGLRIMSVKRADKMKKERPVTFNWYKEYKLGNYRIYKRL